MNNLDNPDILSDELLSIIRRISEIKGDIIYGGSIALNAMGVLSRKVHDIDLCVNNHREYKSIISELAPLSNDGNETYDSVTIIDGLIISRYGLTIKNGQIKLCVFICPMSFLSYSTCYITRHNIKTPIKVQHINYAIEAKRAYLDIDQKHNNDLSEISYNLNYLFNTNDNKVPLAKMLNDLKK